MITNGTPFNRYCQLTLVGYEIENSKRFYGTVTSYSKYCELLQINYLIFHQETHPVLRLCLVKTRPSVLWSDVIKMVLDRKGSSIVLVCHRYELLVPNIDRVMLLNFWGSIPYASISTIDHAIEKLRFTPEISPQLVWDQRCLNNHFFSTHPLSS